jgi:Flp pilus assembly protein TadD
MPDDPSNLTEDVVHRLRRCEGFLDLKMAARARGEWAQLSNPDQQHPTAQRMLLRLLTEEKNWPAARAVAERYQARNPDHAGAWIQLAYTTRRAQSLDAARLILETARPLFPKESVIPYNLACYACQNGELDRARSLLQEAARLDKKALRIAAEDEDLRALWPELDDP